MDRERLVDEVLMLMPTLMRAIGGPDPAEMAEFTSRGVPAGVRVSPGHVQILIALTRGPHSVGQLAEVLGVSPPAATQLVDRLVEHGMVERRHDPADRRVVLVDYVPGMRDVARRLMEVRRRRLAEAMGRLTDEEAGMFVRGLRTLTEGFGVMPGEA
jgi:DNA-binding MarR family transcriptional regulator